MRIKSKKEREKERKKENEEDKIINGNGPCLSERGGGNSLKKL